MAKLDLKYYLENFQTRIPPVEKILTGGGIDKTAFGGLLMQNAAIWTQAALGRAWNRLDIQIPPQAQSFVDVGLDTAGALSDAVATWKAAEGFGKLEAISRGSLQVIETMLGTMDALAGSIPIIGAVARFGLAVQRAFWEQWIAAHTLPPAYPGFRYDAVTDEDYQIAMLNRIEVGDVTSIFLPPFPPGSMAPTWTKVEGYRKNRRDWRLSFGAQETYGLGFLPSGMGLQFAYEGTLSELWSDYLPGAASTAAVAWELARGELRSRVDFIRIKRDWAAWYQRLWELGRGMYDTSEDARVGDKTASGGERKTATIAAALRPRNPDGTPKYSLPPQMGIFTEPDAGRTMAHVVADVVDGRGIFSRPLEGLKLAAPSGRSGGLGLAIPGSRGSALVVAVGVGVGAWLLLRR